jgi:hypothetical protein
MEEIVDDINLICYYPKDTHARPQTLQSRIYPATATRLVVMV